MYAILGEDKSDVEMLNTLVRRIAKTSNLTIRTKGYTGCSELLCKGAKQIKAYYALGISKFIICYDSDRSPAKEHYDAIIEKIIKKSGISGAFCALVPIQEIESWILADLQAVAKIIPSWKPPKEFSNPEMQNDPKEYLEKLSRAANNKPLYVHAIHNPKVADHLNLEAIVNKCPSSLPLFEMVQGICENHPLPKYDSITERRKAIIAKL